MRIIRLSLRNIDRAVREIEDYADSLENRMRELLDRLARVGIDRATMQFKRAAYDGKNDVTVDSEPQWLDDNRLVISASGSSILFIEFGTGIRNDTHPLAEQLNIPPHGTYGKGQGMKESWVYYGTGADAKAGGIEVRDGVIRTRGNHAQRSMYIASREMRERVREIAREVFAE